MLLYHQRGVLIRLSSFEEPSSHSRLTCCHHPCTLYMPEIYWGAVLAERRTSSRGRSCVFTRFIKSLQTPSLVQQLFLVCALHKTPQVNIIAELKNIPDVHNVLCALTAHCKGHLLDDVGSICALTRIIFFGFKTRLLITSHKVDTILIEAFCNPSGRKMVTACSSL